MDYPPAVIDKAHRLEALLKKVAAGASLEAANAELGLEVTPKRVGQLQAKYEAGGQSWEALLDGRYGRAQQMTSAVREWMYQRKRENEYLTAGDLQAMVAAQFGVPVSEGHVNWLLRQQGLTGPAGVSRQARQRQAQREAPAEPEPEAEAQPEPEPQRLPQAGLFFPGGGQGTDGGHPAGGKDPGRGD